MSRIPRFLLPVALLVGACSPDDGFVEGTRFTDDPVLDEFTVDVVDALRAGGFVTADPDWSVLEDDDAGGEVPAEELADGDLVAPAPGEEGVVLARVAAQANGPATLSLTIPRPAYMGWFFTATVTGARPGDRVTLYVAAREGNGPCPRGRNNPCLDLRRPLRLRGAVADATGTARIPIPTPYADPLTRSFQAFVTSGVAAKSGVVRVTFLAMNTDSDGDGAPDPAEAWFGTDPNHPDTDRDGIPDGRDVDPFVRGPFQDFRPNDPVISDPTSLLPDPEWDHAAGRITWQHALGDELWVGGFDLQNGTLNPRDGRGSFILSGASDMRITGNGSEWVESRQGSFVLFSVPDRNARSGHRVGWAFPSGNGWDWDLLPGSRSGFAPLGSHILDHDETWILYFDVDENGGSHIYVRDLLDPSSEVQVPRRIVNADARFADLPEPIVSGSKRRPDRDAPYQQIYLFDPKTRAVTWITDDPFYKFDAYVWIDPRSGDRMALVGRGVLPFALDEIAIYREVGPGPWRLEKVLTNPPGFTWVRHPRVFTWNGRSYVTWIPSRRRTVRDGGLGIVYFASTDADSDLIRRIDGAPTGGKIDPEPVTHGARPWVIYSQGGVNAATGERTRVVRRAELGPLP